MLGARTVPKAGVTSLVLNVTLTQPNSSGFITVYPDDVSRPVASNLNFVPGLTAPNLVVVRVPASGIIDFYHYANFGGTTFLLADVVGYFDNDEADRGGPSGLRDAGAPHRHAPVEPRAAARVHRPEQHAHPQLHFAPDRGRRAEHDGHRTHGVRAPHRVPAATPAAVVVEPELRARSDRSRTS